MSDNGTANSSNGNFTPFDGVTAKIWAIAGGKGGTGKSVVTANLGIALSTLGNSVVVIDGDLGGANLHTCLNIRHPQFNLNDFLTNEKTHLRDILLDTPAKSLKLISGGSELVYTRSVCYVVHMERDTPTAPRRSVKKRTNVSVDAELLARAKDNGLSLSATLEEALRDRLRRIEQERWHEQNRESIKSYNRYVAEHGTFSDKLRSF